MQYMRKVFEKVIRNITLSFNSSGTCRGNRLGPWSIEWNYEFNGGRVCQGKIYRRSMDPQFYDATAGSALGPGFSYAPLDESSSDECRQYIYNNSWYKEYDKDWADLDGWLCAKSLNGTWIWDCGSKQGRDVSEGSTHWAAGEPNMSVGLPACMRMDEPYWRAVSCLETRKHVLVYTQKNSKYFGRIHASLSNNEVDTEIATPAPEPTFIRYTK
eukprot:PhF_6_TR29578/c0_g1_i1/m.43728